MGSAQKGLATRQKVIIFQIRVYKQEKMIFYFSNNFAILKYIFMYVTYFLHSYMLAKGI